MQHGFWATLKQDFANNTKQLTVLRFIRSLIIPDRFNALIWLRIFLWCEAHKLPTFLAYRILFHLHGMEMHKGVSIGPGLFLPHPSGVLIAKKTVIGANCGIYGLVRLLSQERHSPVIEDNVMLGDGAKLLGGVTIGQGTFIGAGAVVTRDIPAHVTAAGMPAKVLRHLAQEENAAES